MIGAVLSLILGCFGLLGAVVPIPRVLPVIGLVLGINGLIKEQRKPEKRSKVVVMCAIGAIMNALPTALFVLGSLMRRGGR